jgi:hypothetical protein
MRVRPAQTSKVKPEPGTGLSRPLPSERLRGLLRQQKTLLTKIKQAQKQRERLTESERDAMAAVTSKLRPLFAERDKLSAAIQALFAELLAEGRLPARSRRQVAEVYAQVRETLGVDADDAASEEQERSGPNAFHPAASHEGRDSGKESIRDVFRRLVLALHPDRAANENERGQRTELMKEVTQAYQAGDLASLLEAEQRWLAGAHDATSGLSAGAQVRVLERAVMELKEQLRRLRAEIKELKRSAPLQMAQAMKQRGRVAPADPFAEALEEAEEELQQLRELLSFVTAFRDKKLTLAEFLRGPPSFQSAVLEIDELLFDFLEQEFVEPRRRGRRTAR